MINKHNIDRLLEAAETGMREIAQLSGCSVSALGRLRSGSRPYKRNSTTVERFAAGICRKAAGSRYEELCRTVRCDTDCSEPALKNAVIDFIFSEDETEEAVSRSDLLGEKLKYLMTAADVTASRLALDLNIDSSYLSHIKRSKRIPAKNSRMIQRICGNLTARLAEMKRTELLGANLNGCENTEQLTAKVIDWLYDDSIQIVGDSNMINVRSIIGSIENMKLPETTAAPVLPEISPEIKDVYTGNDGLRSAAVRFLLTSLSGAKELHLYSDAPMEWMTDKEFMEKWRLLMNACLSKGIRIKIIHNIERGSEELFTAIRSWLPLYMTGLIEGYFCSVHDIGRFSHTLFIAPEACAIEGFCVRGCEDSAGYYFYTGSGALRCEQGFEQLLDRCRPLLTFNNHLAETNGSVFNYGNVQIILTEHNVSVNRLTAPQFSFTFSHPLMHRAFREFTLSEPESGAE